MNKNKKKRKGFNATSMRCPYCGSTVVYRSADGIYHENKKGTMLYVCSNFPECDAYVRVHAGTNIPVGSWQITSFVLFVEQLIITLISFTSPDTCLSRMHISGLLIW